MPLDQSAPAQAVPSHHLGLELPSRNAHLDDVQLVQRAVPVLLDTDDAGELLTLQRAAFVTEAQLHHDLQLPPLMQSLEDLEEELDDPSTIGMGLRLGPRLVAAVRMHLITASGDVELGRLAVAPDVQGRGLGSALVREAESRVPPGTTRIRLFTGEFSAGNLRLYRRLGYEEYARTSTGRHHLVHMVKTLVVDLSDASSRPA